MIHNIIAMDASFGGVYLRWSVRSRREEAASSSLVLCEFPFSFQSMEHLENKPGAIYNVW